MQSVPLAEAVESCTFLHNQRRRVLPFAQSEAAKHVPKPCQFCGIADGTQKAHTVFADELSVAFLDYRPLLPGHVLLIPRGHFPTLAATPDDIMAALGMRVKGLSAAVVQAMAAEGSFVALNNLVSQSVPHVHFHIVPRRKGDGLFSAKMVWKRVAYKSDEERESIAQRIRAAITDGPV
jgi:histidine triad (HIT) family protein